MIRWVFLFLVAGILIWMFSDSKTTRWTGLGVLTAIAALLALFFYVLDRPERREAAIPPPDRTIKEVEDISRKLETTRFALTPKDVALLRRKLEPGTKITWSSEGERMESPDLFSWILTGSVKNLSADHAVKDLVIRVRLFDCPVYFTTPMNDVTASELVRDCSLIGERGLGIYDLRLAPGQDREFREQVRFNDQVEPRNWRYWADIVRVSAAVD